MGDTHDEDEPAHSEGSAASVDGSGRRGADDMCTQQGGVTHVHPGGVGGTASSEAHQDSGGRERSPAAADGGTGQEIRPAAAFAGSAPMRSAVPAGQVRQ